MPTVPTHKRAKQSVQERWAGVPGAGEAGLGTEVLIGQKARPWAPLRGLGESWGPPDRGQEARAPASRGVAQP